MNKLTRNAAKALSKIIFEKITLLSKQMRKKIIEAYHLKYLTIIYTLLFFFRDTLLFFKAGMKKKIYNTVYFKNDPF